MSTVAGSSSSSSLPIDQIGSNDYLNQSSPRAMVKLASDELIALGWDGQDQKDFNYTPTENGMLIRWKSCTFQQEDLEAIQRLVLKKLSSAPAHGLARSEENRLEGRVQVKPSNNDDDDDDAFDRESQTVKTVSQQASRHSLTTNSTQATSSHSSQGLHSASASPKPADSVVSPGMKDLSGEPTLSDVLEAVGWARAAKNSVIETALLLEHFNKDSLFKLYEKATNPKLQAELLAVIGQKIEIREAFERSLIELSKIASAKQRPTCFISFALEQGVSKWLEDVFVPDLMLAGIDPVFCFKDLRTGMDLNGFQDQILFTDHVVVICTPFSEQCCRDRHPPYGFAQEVVLAKSRAKKETVSPVWLKGDPKKFDPKILFGIDDTFGTILNDDGRAVWSYYAKAFRLIGGIKGFIGDCATETSKIKHHFFARVETILTRQDFCIEELKLKAKQQDTASRSRVEGLNIHMISIMKKVSLPPRPNPYIEKREEMQQVVKLYDKGTTRLVAIVGNPGVGKSAFVLALAHQIKHRFDFIYLIQLSGQTTLRQGLLNFANDLKLEGTEEQRILSLTNLIERSDQRHLIIFDNVGDSKIFGELTTIIKSSPECCFLLTTFMTRHTREIGFTPIQLKPYQPEEGLAYLREATHIRDDDENGRRIAEKLQGSPVALARAAEYIRSIHCGFSTFIDNYRTNGLRILTNHLPEHAQTTLTSWKSFLAKIEKNMKGSPCATKLLYHLSSLEEMPVPYQKLQWWAIETGFDEAFDQALIWLNEYALIESPKLDFYTLSPLLKQELAETAQHNEIEHPLKVTSVTSESIDQEPVNPDIITQGIRTGKRPQYFLGVLNLQMLNPKKDNANILRSLNVLIPSLDDNEFPRLTEPSSPLRDFIKHCAELWEEKAKLALALGNWYKTRNPQKSMVFYRAALKSCERNNLEPLSNDLHRGATSLLCTFVASNSENFEQAISERIRRIPKRNTNEHVAALARLVRLCRTIETNNNMSQTIESEIGLCGSPELVHVRDAYARLLQQAKLSPTVVPTHPTISYQEALKAFHAKFTASIPFEINAIKKLQDGQRTAFMGLLNLFIDDAFALIGLPPCDYDIRVVGIMANGVISRDCSFDFCILVNSETVEDLSYFKKLLEILHLQMISLEESLDCASFADLLDLNAPYGVRKFGLRVNQPSRLVMQIGTPKAFTESKLDFELQGLVAHQSISIKSSSNSLFHDYRMAEGILREESDAVTLPRDVRYTSESSEPNINFRQIEEFMHEWLLKVAICLSFPKENLYTIVDEWTKRGGLEPSSAHLIATFLTTLYRIRLRLEQAKRNDFDVVDGKDLSPDEERKLKAGYLLVIKPLVLMLESNGDAIAIAGRRRVSILKGYFEQLCSNLDLVKVAIQNLSSTELKISIEQLSTSLHASQTNDLTIKKYYQLLGVVNSQEDEIRDSFVHKLETLNNPHAAKLLHLPNSERVRVSDTRSRKKFQETLRAITQEDPTVGHPTIKLKSPSLGTCYLRFGNRIGALNDKDNNHEPLFDKNGTLIRKHQGQHPVNSLTLPNGDGVFLKGMPTDPLAEWGIHELVTMIAGEMTPQTELVRCEVPDRALPYPILISQAVKGTPLGNMPNLRWEDCDQKQWTWMFLTHILTKPGDGHASNYLLVRNRENKWMIVCIDNDVSFFPSVTRTKEGFLNIHFASVLFCLFPHVKLDRQVLEEFCALNGDEILSKWMQRLVDKEEQYKTLFTEGERKSLYDEESDHHQNFKEKPGIKHKKVRDHKFRPTMLLSKGTMLILSRQFSRLQIFIQEKLTASKTTTLTPVDLLRQLIDVDSHELSQRIGSHVESKYARCGKQYVSLNDQLTSVTGLDHRESIPAGDALTISLAVDRIPTAQEIVSRKDFTLEQARDELAFFIKSKSIYDLDFGTNDSSRHERMLNAKIQDHIDTKAKPTTIAIKNCDALETKALKQLLHRGVRTLDLSGCRQLIDSDIALICQLCPNLKILRLNHTTITEFDAQMVFPKLSYLELKGCKRLKRVEIRALYLDDVKICELENQVDKNIRMFIHTSRRIRPPHAFDDVLYAFLNLSDLEAEYIPNLRNVWYVRDVALDAIRNKVFGLNFIIRNPHKNDREVCLAFLNAYPQSTEFKDIDPILDRLDPRFKRDVEFVKAAVRFQSKNYRCLNDDMQNNTEVALALVESDPSSFPTLSHEMRMTSKVVIAALKGENACWNNIEIEYVEDPAIVCYALQQLHEPHNPLPERVLGGLFHIHPNIFCNREVFMEWVTLLIKNADKMTIITLLKNWKTVDMAFEFIATLSLPAPEEHSHLRRISMIKRSITEDFKIRRYSFKNDQDAKEINKKMILLIICWMLGNSYNESTLVKLMSEKIDPACWEDIDIAAALTNFYYFNNRYNGSGFTLDQVDHFKSEKQFILNVFRPGYRHWIGPSCNLAVFANWMDPALWNDRDVVAEFLKYEGCYLQRASNQVKNDEQIKSAYDEKFVKDLKQRSETVLSEIKRDKHTITYTVDEFRKDPKFICRAMEVDRGVLKLITYDYEFAFAMVKIDYRIWDYIKEEFQRKPEMVTLMDYRAPYNYVSEFEFRQRDDLEVENTLSASVTPYSLLNGRRKYKWGILSGKGLDRYIPNWLFYSITYPYGGAEHE